MKYGFMDENRSAFPVEKMCQALRIVRSGYYRWRTAGPSRREQENRKLTDEIREIHEASWKIYGVPRVYRELKDRGVACSENRVCRLMKKAGIRSRVKRKYRATTDSRHSLPIAPNWLERKFEARAPNEVWSGDITYIWTWEGWLYLAVVIDLYSRKIVGWAVSPLINTRLTLEALNQAIRNRRGGAKRMFHSDRGSQYAAEDFRKVLAQSGIVQSMSRKGNCYDNAVTESFFHSLKTEWLSFLRFETRQQARSAVFEYIEMFYNSQRRHSSLGFLSPAKFEQLAFTA